MTKDMHRNKGGFLGSYGQWFKSIGLYGQKWKWHLKVGKFDCSSVVNFWWDLNECFLSSAMVQWNIRGWNNRLAKR